MRLQADTLVLPIFRYLGGQARSHYRRAVLSLLEPAPEASMLDLGCGDGKFTMELARRMGTSNVSGIDILADSASRAREKGVEVRLSDLNTPFPFQDESFSVVHAGQVIEHLHDTDSFLREIHRVLEPGGYLIISTPNLASLHNILCLLMGRQPFPATVSDEVYAGVFKPGTKHIESAGPAHRRIFTMAGLKELLEHHGFRVEKRLGSGFYPLPGPLARLMCAIDRWHAAYIVIKAKKRRRGRAVATI